MDCPKCIGKLQKTTFTNFETSEVKELQGATVTYNLELDKCFVCGGVWFDKGELDKYLTEKVTVIDSSSVGADLDKELDAKKGNCPRCQVEMKKTAAPKDPSITVDTCEKCGGVWLDSTEIDRLECANKEKNGFLALFFKGFKNA